MCNFKVGQKVVCVRNGEAIDSLNIVRHNIYKDKIYTVKKTGHMEATSRNVAFNYVIVEEVAGIWWEDKFRPIENISSTKEILEKFKPTEEVPDTEIKHEELILHEIDKEETERII